jgi:hypothetical protein
MLFVEHGDLQKSVPKVCLSGRASRAIAPKTRSAIFVLVASVLAVAAVVGLPRTQAGERQVDWLWAS